MKNLISFFLLTVGCIAFSQTNEPTHIDWIDAQIIPMSTVVRASHFNQLRNALNQKRNACGLSSTVWTDDPLIAGVTEIKKIHMDELRTASTELEQAAATRNRTQYVETRFEDPTIESRITEVKAAHLQQIRTIASSTKCGGTPPPPCGGSFGMQCGTMGCNGAAWNQFRNALAAAAAQGKDIGNAMAETLTWPDSRNCTSAFMRERFETGSSADITYSVRIRGTEDQYREPYRSRHGRCTVSYAIQCR